MIASSISGATRVGESLCTPSLTRLLVGLLMLVFCTRAFAQNPLGQDPFSDAQVWPDTQPDFTTESGQLMLLKNAIFGDQVVSANALRAPAKARTAAMKALTAISKNQRGEAEQEISRALQIYPDYAAALTLRAFVKARTHPSDTIADLEHAIRADPAFGLACAVLGNIYNSLQRYDDASPLVERALQLLPLAWQVHFEMARTLFGKHQSRDALPEVNDAIRRVAGDKTASSEARAALHFLRGQILLDQSEYEAAKLEFELTLKLSSHSIFAQHSNQILAQLESLKTR